MRVCDKGFEDRIDPELLEKLISLAPLSNSRSTVEEIKRNLYDLEVPVDFLPDYKVMIEEKLIDGPCRRSKLRVRIYSPSKRSTNDLPALLWIHGGGFISGSPTDDDSICQLIVQECKCVVVSVDYRLAPQHPFPAGFDDCYMALQWLASAGAAELGICTERVAVGGCSAGGCIAAGVALKARDENGPKIVYQMLLIPALDDRHGSPSSSEITDSRVWNGCCSKIAWAVYLKDFPADVPICAAPARAKDLSGLAAAFISVEECDLLRDEGIQYAQRLMQAQVQTELHVYPGAFHGSMFLVPEADVSKAHIRDMLHALNKKLNQ